MGRTNQPAGQQKDPPGVPVWLCEPETLRSVVWEGAHATPAILSLGTSTGCSFEGGKI